MTTPPPAPPPAAAPAGPADVQATFAATLVDEWVRAGLTDAVVCPGSRSTPLALALADAADRGRLRLHVHHDERSGAFLALGIGLATGRPAVVLTTSGTAAAELHPGVVEADLAAVPLLACTADRPPELRDVGAPQAIDQVHLFGRSVRWYGDPGVPDDAGRDRWRAFAARAYAATTGHRPGPVHLNLPFREPLVGGAAELPPPRPGGDPWARAVDAAGDAAPALADLAADLAGRRGIVVAGSVSGCAGGVDGGLEGGLDGDAVHEAAAALGWPVVAEPRSPAWRPADSLVPHLDAVLRSPRAAAELRPEVIVRLGAPGASRVVNEWLAASGAVEVVAGAPGWSDPSATAAVLVDRAGPLVSALAAAAAAATPPDGWLARWRTVAEAARVAADGELGPAPPREDGPTEPAAARAVVRGVAAGTTLVVSSSMPIRDVERYAVPRREIRVVANRGANGIDGVVSTAVGVALGTQRADGAAHRRRRVPPRQQRAARGGGPRYRPALRGGRQRRRGHLLLPAAGPGVGRGPVRDAVRHAPRPRPGGAGVRLRRAGPPARPARGRHWRSGRGRGGTGGPGAGRADRPGGQRRGAPARRRRRRRRSRGGAGGLRRRAG